MGEEDQYEVAERVFAKMKGYPPWPAKVVERVPGKEEKYRINFYGTHDDSVVKLDQLYRYNDETKAKYGKPQRKAQFKQAMEEIEADVIATADPDSPAVVEDAETVADSEGELMIDEGFASLPPVLTREASKPESNENSKSRRPRTLSKRDSVSSASGAPVVTTTIATPEASQPSTNEIVSRSGRKIKPKRFADDEITSPAVNKAGGKAAGSEESGPPAKRAKRTSKSNGSKNATLPPATPEDKTEKDIPTPTKAKAGAAKAKAAAIIPVPVPKQSGRLSPDISAPRPPSLTAAPVRRSGSGSKKLPALIPTSALPKHANTRRSERQTRSKSMEEEESQNEIPQLPLEEPEDVEDKENSANKSPKDKTVEENDDESNEVPIANKKRPVPPAQKLPSPVEKKVRVAGKNGVQYELSFDSQNPDFKTGEESQTWNTIAKKNVEKLKDDLLHGDAESQEIINCTAEVVENVDSEETKMRETRSIQIRLLRLEGEVIEIIGEIVGCLNVSSADCDRAVELLDRLESHQLNPLMLKKHPEVVRTVLKLRSYVGNVDAWGFTAEQKAEFGVKASGIRQKAVEVFKHFQDLFCANPEESFLKVFNNEVDKFQESISGLPLKSVLGLTEVDDESGELQVYDSEMNGDDGEEELPVPEVCKGIDLRLH